MKELVLTTVQKIRLYWTEWNLHFVWKLAKHDYPSTRAAWKAGPIISNNQRFVYQSANKANLRDLIAATGLVILLKFDPNHRFFSPFDLEIWWMTLENNRAPLLYYTKLCASFQIHRWIETEVTVRKHSIRVKIGDFLSCVTLKFDG